MLIRDEIQALRSNDAPQRHAQAELALTHERWCAGARYQAIEAEMQRYGAGEALDRLPVLADLFTPGSSAARDLLDSLFGVLLAELRARPFGQVPLRHFCNARLASLLIASVGSVGLVVQTIDGAGLRRRDPFLTASFPPGETWEHVLAGTGEAELLEIVGQRPGGVELQRRPCSLVPGTVNRRDGSRESLMHLSIPTSLVLLKLQRRVEGGAVAREYRLSDGVQLHQAAASLSESRLELAAALLGRMGRSDAAPLLAAMAEEHGGDSLRWQSLRECLALDSRTGFVTLCRIAGRADDPLSGPAGALRAQLLETYPQLKEAAACQG